MKEIYTKQADIFCQIRTESDLGLEHYTQLIFEYCYKVLLFYEKL